MPITRAAPSTRSTANTAGLQRHAFPGAVPVYAPSVSGTRTSLSGWLARMGFADVPRAERELAALGISRRRPPGARRPRPGRRPRPRAGRPGADRRARTRPHRAAHQRPRVPCPADRGARRQQGPGRPSRPAPGGQRVLRGQDADRRQDASAIRAGFLRAVAADPGSSEPRADLDAGKTDPAARLAAAYRRRVLHLAARDLTGEAPWTRWPGTRRPRRRRPRGGPRHRPRRASSATPRRSGSRSSRWASAAPASSTTPATST